MPIQIDTLKLTSLAADGAVYGMVWVHPSSSHAHLLTGIFLSMFVVCGYDLVRRAMRKESQLSWPMVVAGMLLILLATIRFALNAAYVAIGFLQHDTHAQRIAFFHNVKNDIFRARHIVFIIVQLVADLFAVRRRILVV